MVGMIVKSIFDARRADRNLRAKLHDEGVKNQLKAKDDTIAFLEKVSARHLLDVLDAEREINARAVASLQEERDRFRALADELQAAGERSQRAEHALDAVIKEHERQLDSRQRLLNLVTDSLRRLNQPLSSKVIQALVEDHESMARVIATLPLWGNPDSSNGHGREGPAQERCPDP
jgi:hypothetical protein